MENASAGGHSRGLQRPRVRHRTQGILPCVHFQRYVRHASFCNVTASLRVRLRPRLRTRSSPTQWPSRQCWRATSAPRACTRTRRSWRQPSSARPCACTCPSTKKCSRTPQRGGWCARRPRVVLFGGIVARPRFLAIFPIASVRRSPTRGHRGGLGEDQARPVHSEFVLRGASLPADSEVLGRRCHRTFVQVGVAGVESFVVRPCSYAGTRRRIMV